MNVQSGASGHFSQWNPAHMTALRAVLMKVCTSSAARSSLRRAHDYRNAVMTSEFVSAASAFASKDIVVSHDALCAAMVVVCSIPGCESTVSREPRKKSSSFGTMMGHGRISEVRVRTFATAPVRLVPDMARRLASQVSPKDVGEVMSVFCSVYTLMSSHEAVRSAERRIIMRSYFEARPSN